MRYMRFMLLVCAVAVLASSMTMAVPRPRTIAVCGTITAIDTTANTITVTPPPPPPRSMMPVRPPVTFGVTADTKILLDDDPVDITGLAVGEWCNAWLTKAADGTLTATRVSAVMPSVCGTISAIDADNKVITVQPPSPRWARNPVPAVQFQVTDTTTIDKNGAATLADLLVGDFVKVSYLEPADPSTMLAAVKIKVLPDHFMGKVTAVDAALGTISVQSRGTTMTFNVDPNAKIFRARKAATLADIQVGDYAEVAYFNVAAGPLAVNISAVPPVVRGHR